MRTVDKPAHGRWLVRYRWLRARDIKSTLATELAHNIGKFRDFVASEGFDPDVLGDFARYVVNPGQRERCGGAALPPRHERIVNAE
jgi:hypothetical protein